MSTLKKNYALSISYQILVIIIPLLTMPYLSKILGAKGVGVYSYTATIMLYFSMFGFLGIVNYGGRKIAQHKSNTDEISTLFSEIYSIQAYSFLFVLILYLIYVCFTAEYALFSLIWGVNLLANGLDITWLYHGLEKFNIAITRNIIIKLGSLITIFIFVKKYEHIWVYIFITAISALLSQFILWVYKPKQIKFSFKKIKKIKKHMKYVLILFIPIISVSMYTMLGKVLLGYFSTIDQVGIFENSQKILSVPIGIISALGVVMLPRATLLVKEKKDKELSAFTENSIRISLFLSIGMSVGIISIAPSVVTLFLGEEFYGAIRVLNILVISIPFIALANVIRTQYILPNEKDSIYVKSVIIGATINIILLMLLIKKTGIIGVSIGVVTSEIIVFLYQYIKSIKIYPVKRLLIYSLKSLFSGFIMFLIISFFYSVINNLYLLVIIQVFSGFIIYSVTFYLLNKLPF